MKKNLSILLAVIAWGAVITQYFLMIENRVASVGETTIRFFSFFTILTNSLVAIYFTSISVRGKNSNLLRIQKPGVLTSITVYITVVGLVYQIVLRQIWQPTGIQMIVDELLHSIIPISVIAYWYGYEDKSVIAYGQIIQWLIYPLLYLLFILGRGGVSNFYPYPFVDVAVLGLPKVVVNSIILLALFVVLSALFIKAGKIFQSRK